MRIAIPTDLTTEAQRDAYRRGWRDRGTKAARKAGRTVTPAKQAAARKNGKRGGRPRKSCNVCGVEGCDL